MKIADRLAMYGEATIANEELLGAVLGKNIAEKLFEEFGTLRQIGIASLVELISVSGVGKQKAAIIKAVFELFRRTGTEELPTRTPIRSPEDIFRMFEPRMRDLKMEVFFVALLDGRNNVMSIRKVADGSPTMAVPTVYGILHLAVSQGAAGIVAVHNHPSGSTVPSREDKRFTESLKQACDVLEVKCVDHIIIGDTSFCSLTEAGII